MRIKLAPICALLGLSIAAPIVHAESLVDGDADAGKAKAITCTACHGPEGNSQNPLWPNIAGQNAKYLADQLQAFKVGMQPEAKDGVRKDPLMSSQAMLLSDEDMADLAVYFESLPGAAQAVANVDLIDRGEALYRGGNLENKASACIACHGPTGRGNPAAGYPALQGQHAVYTAKQLRDYKAGARSSDGKTRQMRDIAARLDDKDIEALASYVQGLR
ncbi:MAG: c-type cytochrome [Woeseiaceae bacterium]